MRIALLGTDDVNLAVAAAAVRDGHDQIVLATGLGKRAEEISRLIPGAQQDDDWERLLDTNVVDAVLVAADQPTLRVDQLRRLIQLGIPALVSHPVSLSMLEYYELDMIRSETHARVLAYLPARWHPAAAELRVLLEEKDASPLGSIEQVVFERFLPQRDRETVLRQFARDADLLQFIAGPATRLHASGSAGASGAYSNLGVQLTCDHGILCRWTVGPVEAESGGRLTLVGPQGKAVLWMPDGSQTWQLETRGKQESTAEEFPDWDAPALALEKLAAAQQGDATDPSWSEAARTVELADTIDVSLKRGRTIDLHHEEFTDIGTFKGTMTSLGCGLLVAGLILVVFILMARALAFQAGWNRLVEILDFWPYVLLGVLGIYLVLQMLVLIGKPSKLPNRQGEPDQQNIDDRHDLST